MRRIDPTRTWAKVEERLASETDPETVPESAVGAG
jgi:hypothetical protein